MTAHFPPNGERNDDDGSFFVPSQPRSHVPQLFSSFCDGVDDDVVRRSGSRGDE